MADAEGHCSCRRNRRKCRKRSRIPNETAAKFIAHSIANVVRLSRSKKFCGKVLNQAGVCDLSELSGVVEQKLLGLLNPNATNNAEIQAVNAFLDDDDALEKDEDEEICLSPSLLRDFNSSWGSAGASFYGRLSPQNVTIDTDDDEDEKMETCPSPSMLHYGDTSTLSADSSEDWLPFDSSPQRREWIARTVDMIDCQIENDQCCSSQSLLRESSSSLLEDSCDVSQDLYDVWPPDHTPTDPNWISVTIDLIDNAVGDANMRSTSPSLLRGSSFMDSLSTDSLF